MPTILIIDDSRLSRSMLADPLSEGGFKVVQAQNGQEGLDAYEECPPTALFPTC